MRDPDLVLHARRAAMALEQAWDRWRTIHRQGTEPLPPVSSYVGYSLEEPWGQPRVVFGVAAAEAEQIAALMDGHDCVGPVHATLAALPEGRVVADPAGRADAERGRGTTNVQVPTQAPAQAEVGAWPRAHDADSREDLADRRDAAEAPGPAPRDDRGVGEPDLAAFRPQRAQAAYPEDGAEPGPFVDDPDDAEELAGADDVDELDGPDGAQDPEAAEEPAEAGGPDAGWASADSDGVHGPQRVRRSAREARAARSSQRAGREPRRDPAPRAAGSSRAAGPGRKPGGRDRKGLAAMAAELAGWASGELPGQASHRFPPRPPG